MALINCPECQKEISSVATSCPHCGYPIKSEENKSMKNILSKKVLFIALIVVALIIIGCIIGILSSNKGYWDNNKWGTTYEDIKNKYGSKISESSVEEGALAMYSNDMLDVKGLDCMVNYSFDANGELDAVTLICTNNSLKSNEEIKELLIDSLSKEYGKGQEDTYGYDWETSVSVIKLRQYPTMQGGVVISFEAKEDNKESNKKNDVSESGVEDVIDKMASYLGTSFDTKVHGWDNPPSDTAEIKGAGGIIYKGEITCCDDISQKTTIKEVYWRIENHNYFSKLYPIFTEVYGEPDEEFTRTSVEWDMGDYTVLLQDNHDITQVIVKVDK